MKRLILICCLLTLLAAGTDFQTVNAKNAKADRDKTIARAAEIYKQALLNADKAYETKLKAIGSNQQVQKTSGEKDRIDAAILAIDEEIKQAQDKTTALAIVSADSAAAAASGLHKGMTKAELLICFPKKPDSDTTNADGTETIVWMERALVHSGSVNGGIVSTDEMINSMNQLSMKTKSITTVTLNNGVVVDFSVQKQ